MRQLIPLLLLLVLAGWAIAVYSLRPTVDTAVQSWVAAETRTDPIDDLVRFRQAEQSGRRASRLLPIFILATVALLLLALLTPLPHLLKALRLRRKAGDQRRGHRAPSTHPWLEQTPPNPHDLDQPGQEPAERPSLPHPHQTGWLEEA